MRLYFIAKITKQRKVRFLYTVPISADNNSCLLKKNAGGINCMKATGIVRRIDDLGRVVIPKEIRRTMRIREGDPLEI